MASATLILRCGEETFFGVGRHRAKTINWVWDRVNMIAKNVIALFIPIQKEYARLGIVRVHSDDYPATNFYEDVCMFHQSLRNILFARHQEKSASLKAGATRATA